MNEILDKIRTDSTYVTGINKFLNPKVELEVNKFGFYEESLNGEKLRNNLYKELDHKALGEHLFGKICSKKNDIIGHYEKLYAGFVNENTFRKEGSSGGMVSWLLVELLKREEIDAVIHVKENNKNQHIKFTYQISQTEKEIRQGSKSKYYPVELSQVLDIVSKTNKRYAIVGTPYFISSIRNLQNQHKVIKKNIKFTIGLICGHEKSKYFFESIAWRNDIDINKIKTVNFRKKIPYQKANHYGIEFTLENDDRVTFNMQDQLEKDWGLGYFKLPASDFITDVMNETADVVFGDAWHKRYNDDYRGTNIVIVRNRKILEIIEESRIKNKLHLESVDEEFIISCQKGHIRHTLQEYNYRKKIVGVSESENTEMRTMRKVIQRFRFFVSRKSFVIFLKNRQRNTKKIYSLQLRIYNYLNLTLNRIDRVTKYIERI